MRNEVDKTIGIILDTIYSLEDSTVELAKMYKLFKEENNMNCYELAFIGFDGDCYNIETTWLIRTTKTYNDMLDYVDNINKQFRDMYPNTKSYFVFNEEELFNDDLTFDKILEDLKEL